MVFKFIQVVLGNLHKIIWILIIISLFSAINLWRLEKAKVNDLKSYTKAIETNVETWKDKAGKNHTRAEAAELRAKNVELISKDLKKHIEAEVGSLKRNLISYANIKMVTQGKVDMVTKSDVLVSSESRNKNFNYTDKYIQIEGSFDTRTDSITANYKVNNNFELFYYYRKPGKGPLKIFRRKRAVAEIKFDNPNSQTDSIFTIILERKKGLFGKFRN